MTLCAASDILTYWLGDPQSSSYPEWRNPLWFGHKPEVDQYMRDHFMDAYRAAAAGELDHWTESAHGHLALILLLDQFSRNLFRGDAAMYAADDRAVDLSLRLVESGRHLTYHPLEQLFIYLPLEHAENVSLQRMCVRLFDRLVEEVPDTDRPRYAGLLDYAHKHRDVVEKYGRFPHRNAILGRPNTPAEEEYLATPGAGF
jgi:uncharacterized protein (DUF924 family)